MKRLFAFTAIILLAGNTYAFAQNERNQKVLRAFDALCVSTLLDPKIFGSQVKLFKNRKIEKNVLYNMSPDNEIGYWVKFEGMLVTTMLGKRTTAGGVKSNACTLVVKDLPFLAASQMLEINFPVQRIDRFKQGVSEIAIYQGSFAGYRHSMALSVQVGEGIASISIFELSGK